MTIPSQPPSKIPWTPLILTMLTQAAATMAAYTLSTASPHIAPDLGVENEDVAQLVAIVYGVGAISALFAPPLVHRFGGMAISLAICTAAGAMQALAVLSDTILMLGLASIALGCCYGMTAPSSSHVLAKLAPAKRRNIIFSIRQIGVPMGGILGGLLIPPLILLGGWRLAFSAQLVFVLILALSIYMVRHRYDFDRDLHRRILRPSGPARVIGLLRELPELRPLAFASVIYSGIQLCFGAFLVTQIVRLHGQEAYHFASAIALVTFQLSGIGTRIVLGFAADAWISARTLLAAQGVLMGISAIIAAQYDSGWPLWLILANTALAGATASGYTGLAFAEFARIGGPPRAAETTGLGAALMFGGVAIMAPLFRLGIDVFGGYAVPFLVIAALAFISAAVLILFREKPVVLSDPRPHQTD
ncbi:MAG: MFS transporter [Alphaproteobacteria bacterium]|mgnify:FL=1|jgi:predicted MFS family arabinose efflux permease|nr:MFS transporter [Alphaproteobacteria bacterium]